MGKTIRNIIISIIAGSVLFYLISASRPKKEVSTYISFNKRDKNPYGAYVFYESLKRFFPGASFKINYSDPGDNKMFGDNVQGQLYVILRSHFEPDRYEVDDLITFIDRGNNVLISTFHINGELDRFVQALSQTRNYQFFPWGEEAKDTLTASLSSPPFVGNSSFTYPGASIEGYFKGTDSSISQIIGYGSNGQPNFIRLKKGEGHLYIHLSPMALTNYFLLYGNNIGYFEKMFSLMPAETPVVIWDEYFNSLSRDNSNNKGWFSAIMKNNYFRAGILTALLLILVYALTEIRRKQRAIPVIKKPTNDSLDFVKTMGLLYYERGDHYNLAQKLSAYFMEHVRSRYQLFSQKPDSYFIEELSYKSGVDKGLVSDIIKQVNRISAEGSYTDTELLAFHRNIDEFYNQE